MEDSAIVAGDCLGEETLQGAREAEITTTSPFTRLIRPSLFQQEQPEQVSPRKGSSASQRLSASPPALPAGFWLSRRTSQQATPAAWCPKLARRTVAEGTGWQHHGKRWDEDEEQSHTPEWAGRREQGKKVEVGMSLVNQDIDSAVLGSPCPTEMSDDAAFLEQA
ncbi:hypothetical protein llap_5556 [Limosa lapponica baueri]|uniref:Uncharacterized protein n=1 Tax=Limosa lapponica baueri TaxID=1758121 RepID=A0A2I0UDL8_LIMLA|nr:hypothetical protein llap_5556 [Limosa lapponica baueri]